MKWFKGMLDLAGALLVLCLLVLSWTLYGGF